MIPLQRPGALSALPPLSLYVHLPWCLRKCPYCDFNSHEPSAAQSAGSAGTGHLSAQTEARYLDALRADLESALPQIWGRRVYTVFIGGGTPSLFSPDSIDRLLSDIRARLPLEADAEITLEANPGTFETDRFKAFHQAGINRLSIGVQSFDDAKLRALGRVHNRAQAIAAVEEAQRNFETFNLDLMYALPGQTLAQCEADLRTALPDFDSRTLVGRNFDVFHRDPSHQRRLLGDLTQTHRGWARAGGRSFQVIANPVVSRRGEKLGSVIEWRDLTEELAIEAEISAIFSDRSAAFSTCSLCRSLPYHWVEKPPHTVAEAIDARQDNADRRNLSDRHRADLKSRLKQFREDFGSRQIADVSMREVEAWLHRLNVSPQTWTNYARVIGSVFSLATKRGFLDTNPLAVLDRPKIVRKAPPILTASAASPEK